MDKVTHKTIRISKKLGELLHIEAFPSAGPNPNVLGMKKHYYGLDSYCILCGDYLYKVNSDTYYTAIARQNYGY